ncbi:hypothetical protein QQF64_020239 [Cirrhinus molitorella]|uniref:Uncharacterized protein n=2 Tax=Cirrhinus molitorella TaxID=172907 RepID=A0AA88PSN8_9TELE|nr:hypothetical protein Q8A67_016939 [Cirrhinus molitorella]
MSRRRSRCINTARMQTMCDHGHTSAESSRRGRAPGQPVPGNGSCQTRGIPAKNTRSPPLELQKRRHEQCAGGVGSRGSGAGSPCE